MSLCKRHLPHVNTAGRECRFFEKAIMIRFDWKSLSSKVWYLSNLSQGNIEMCLKKHFNLLEACNSEVVDKLGWEHGFGYSALPWLVGLAFYISRNSRVQTCPTCESSKVPGRTVRMVGWTSSLIVHPIWRPRLSSPYFQLTFNPSPNPANLCLILPGCFSETWNSLFVCGLHVLTQIERD